MGKFLKVVTCIILVLSIVALVLAIQNFKKREILIGRAHTLEERVISLARMIEERDPVSDEVAEYPEKDIDAVTDRIIEVPQPDNFWETYESKYEVVATPTMDLTTDDRRLQLRQYFYMQDVAPGKKVPVKDPLSGSYKTDGPRTMDELLKQVQERANSQFKWLNETRHALTTVREKLVETIRELNDEKKAHRVSKKKITDLEAEIVRLNGEIEERDRRIAQLEREKSELNDKIVALEEEKLEMQGKIDDLQKECKILEKKLDEATRTDQGTQKALAGSDADARIAEKLLSPGMKGTIAFSDSDLGYVIVKLTDETMAELSKAENKIIPQVEFMVRRKGLDGPAGDFVTRIRLRKVQRENGTLGIADNLQSWEQVDPQPGDEVFF